MADKAKTALNRPVVVDTKSGAGGRIAVEALRTAPADGSVVMLEPDALTALYPFTFKTLSDDPCKDLVPIGTVAEFAFGLGLSARGQDPARADRTAQCSQSQVGAGHQGVGLHRRLTH